MKKSLIPLTLAVAFGVAASVAHSQVVITDTFDANFANFSAQANQPAAIDGFEWSSANGVGEVSGRINAIGTANHQDKVYYSGAGAAVTWSTGLQYGTSISFLPGMVATGNVFEVRSGFIRSTGSEFGGGGSSVWGQVRQDSSGNPFLRLYQVNTQVGSNSDIFTISNTLWYELETTMTLTNATTGDLSVNLFSRGADGTGARTLVESISASGVTIGNSGFDGAEIWAGFGGGNNSGSNIAAFDNFSVAVVPEPSTWGLILGSLSVGIVVLRRRRRQV